MPGVSGRTGSPFRPSTPVLNESAFRFLQSQSDGGLDGADETPRYNQPSVRFDTSRNTQDAEPGTSAFRDYATQPTSKSASLNQTFPKSSFGGSRSTNMMQRDDSEMPSASFDCNDQSLRESILGVPNMASTPKGRSAIYTCN